MQIKYFFKKSQPNSMAPENLEQWVATGGSYVNREDNSRPDR